MTKLTQQQVEQLRQKGLNDQTIVKLAAKNGDTLPDQELGGGFSAFRVGLGKSALSTAVGTASLLQKGGQAALAAITPGKSFEDIRSETGFKSLDKEKKEGLGVREILQPQGTSEEAGKFVGDFAQFFVPTSATKATQGANFLGRVFNLTKKGVKEGVEVATISSAQQGEFSGKEGVVAATIPVAGATIKGTAKIFNSIAKNTSAALAGVSDDVIEEVLKNPKIASKGINKKSVDVLRESANSLKKVVVSYSDDASKAYQEALENLPKRLGRNPKVTTAGQKTTIKVDGKKYILSMKGVKSQLTQNLKKFGVEVDTTKKTFDFLETPFVDSEEKIVLKMANIINEWTDTTPAGLNMLARKVRRLRKTGSPEINAVVDMTASSIRKYIGKRVPESMEMNIAYQASQDFLNTLKQTFGVTQTKNLNDSEIIKISQKLGTIFNKNKEMSMEILRDPRLALGDDLIATLAGREMTGRGLSTAKIGDKISALIQGLLPIAKIVEATGIARPKVEAVMNGLGKLTPAEKAAFFAFITGDLDLENQNQ